MSRRAQLILMLLVSGLLHVALFAALSGGPTNDPRRRSARPRTVEMDVVYQDATPPLAPTEPPPPEERSPSKQEDSPRLAERPRAPVPRVPDASAPREPLAPVVTRPKAGEPPTPDATRPGADESLASDATKPSTDEPPASDTTGPRTGEPPPALARDVPRDLPTSAPRLNLEPKDLLGGGPLRAGPPSTGRTLLPGEGPNAKALAAQEAEVVGERVDDWAQTAAASARASTGATHPYFARLREGFAKNLVNPPPPDLTVLSDRLKREQVEAIARFGKTGSPVVSGPRDQRLEQRNRLQAAVEAGRAANMYMVDITEPVLALAAIVEVWQARDGKLLDLKVLEGSGDPKFDTWAVSQLRDALASTAAPPDASGGLGIRDDGMRSRWRLEEYLGNPRVQIRLIGVY
ncbi:Ferric siderophore transport system, periplasmic binding protein TonB [Myxococcus hansupus]|uniref:Ferric siderophore transport system, periplasmic binding protein TonB n=1 Tax=Pseudomyxococcus hansupus TaxID=1297742 RepID=A0A0H4X0F4_9BACT|nr:hypothetical protein [Myxococcus hansupus]AKQ69201.1 Ferric siderophore transport system, periplasmic binding protein TonB [Myxococcus hansupus]